MSASKDFPGTGSEADQLRFLVNYAILAPSGHNTQPWLFRVGAGSLDLLADRTRALPVVDPHDRALTISCGAALEHLAVAARYFGLELAITPLPGRDADVLASVRIAGEAIPDAADTAMFLAMPQRRTTRVKYEDRILSAELGDACRALAAERGVELLLFSDDTDRGKLADLVAEGDRAQFRDVRFRRELAAWIHTRRSATRDGMSGAAFGMPDLLSPVGAFVIRTFDLGNGVAAADRDKILSGTPLLGVFGTRTDGPDDWLAAGRAHASVLLKLAAAGATAAYLNQPIEVDEIRPRLQSTIGTASVPQLLMRFGYADPVPASIRRPVADVLIALEAG